MLKFLVILLCTSVLGIRTKCNEKTVAQYLRTPTYNFSIRILDRISQETNGHFVFSPISTWLQLLMLAEGAQEKTLNEILRLSGLNNTGCSRELVREMFNTLDKDVSETMKRSSIFVIDKLLNVKESFVSSVEKANNAKVLPVSFESTKESAAEVNAIINSNTNGLISDVLSVEDFFRSLLLVIDVASMKANWLSSFDYDFTKPETFYAHERVPIGEVNMMQQTGSFNLNNIPEIDAQALELPFSDRASMILLLPNNENASNLFLSMKNTRLETILSLLKSNGPKLVNVKLPRFNITTHIHNIPELLHDMGAYRILVPRYANFKNISDYRLFISMMTQKTNIEVTETGVSANVGPDLLVKPEEAVEVSFNRPFAYLVIDKLSNIILFAGIYSQPFRV